MIQKMMISIVLTAISLLFTASGNAQTTDPYRSEPSMSWEMYRQWQIDRQTEYQRQQLEIQRQQAELRQRQIRIQQEQLDILREQQMQRER